MAGVRELVQIIRQKERETANIKGGKKKRMLQ